MLADIWLVANKDLRIEWRSRVTLSQIVPFALAVLVLFGFAFNTNREVLTAATSGIFWLTILFVAVIAVSRAFAIEIAEGAGRALAGAGLEPAAVFLGKSVAVASQLLLVELVMVPLIVLLYDISVKSLPLLALTCVVAALAIAFAGTLMGALVAGLKSREGVLPLLLLPLLAPVLISASRAFDDALGELAVNGWAWLALLGAFGILNAAFGSFAYGHLQEEA